MKSSPLYIAAVFCFLWPMTAKAQSVGQVECPRNDGYVYLYSSMTTMDVRATLQCGEQVQITGRYDTYFGVRTAKGEIGYVPLSSLLLVKDKPGANTPKAKPQPPARPRMAYDESPANAETPPSAVPSASGFTLLKGTPIHLKLNKTISSGTAHVGDIVDLEVLEEVHVDGLCVIPEGANAIGIVTEAEPKKRMGHGAKLGLSINIVRLRDNEKAAVRSYQDSTGASSSAGGALPTVHGKEVVFTQGTEFAAYVDGDIHLKREAFPPAKGAASAAPAVTAQHP